MKRYYESAVFESDNRHLLWLLLCVGSLLGLMLLVPYDRQLTQWLGQQNSVRVLALGFDQSLFEGEGFGFSDAPIFGYLIALGLLLVFWRRRRQCWRCAAIIEGAGFVCYSGLVIALAFVHPMKKIWSRPRPYEVFGSDELPYFDWYQPVTIELAGGPVSGSLPSGHTATFLFFVALIYALRPILVDSLWMRRAAICVCLVACVFMGLSRSVVQAHWVSDWLLTISLGWLIIDVLYFKVWTSADRWRMLAPSTSNVCGAPSRWLRMSIHFLRYPFGLLAMMVAVKLLAVYS